jgi:hypothetical protein
MKDFEIAETNIFKVLFVYKSCELKTKFKSRSFSHARMQLIEGPDVENPIFQFLYRDFSPMIMGLGHR